MCQPYCICTYASQSPTLYFLSLESQSTLDIKGFLLCLVCSAVWFQEISRMESELANLDSQIQMQQESVEAKEAEMKTIRDQIDKVLLSVELSQPVST